MVSKSSKPSTKSAVSVAPKQQAPKKRRGKEGGKTHKRSRSGCYTCRLRRKKCDEGKNSCRACQHLGLLCEYKRPLWWGNSSQRKQRKEDIKDIIKRTKTAEKLMQQRFPATIHHNQCHESQMALTTPSCFPHPLPTPATYSVAAPTRPSSIDLKDGSPCSMVYDFSQPPPAYNVFDPQLVPVPAQLLSPPSEVVHFSFTCPAGAYDVDVKTERETYIDNVSARKDSSTSTYSIGRLPIDIGQVTCDEWMNDAVFDSIDLFGYTPPATLADLDSAVQTSVSPAPTSADSLAIELDHGDRVLLDHFLNHVLRLALPILEVTRPGSVRDAVVLPALSSNKTYLHCCLSVAAVHLKSTRPEQHDALDEVVVRHRVDCISGLCSMLNREQQQVLEATLGMILFPCSVGPPDSNAELPDIAWHDHFEAACSLARHLDLTHAMKPDFYSETSYLRPPFHTSLIAWIDILGATLLGRSPSFADMYREKNEQGASCGLQDMMGCEDRVMYLISEIACLDSLKLSHSIDDLQICELVKALGMHLDATETNAPLAHPISPVAGTVQPEQLLLNITHIFRLAARIYLCSLVPNSTRFQDSICTLVDRLALALDLLPAGPEGFDRCLVWPLLIAGSLSTPTSHFRQVWSERLAMLGDEGGRGSFGRLAFLLDEIWQQQQQHACDGQSEFGPVTLMADGEEDGRASRDVHWRDVMGQMGWTYLLL